jgi:HlyD family secretion protein
MRQRVVEADALRRLREARCRFSLGSGRRGIASTTLLGVAHMTPRLIASVFLSGIILVVSCLVAARAGDKQPLSGPVSATGRIEGGSAVLSLGTSATGTIAQLLVKVGDHVEAGQHLLQVDCRAIEAEKIARTADLAASEAVFARVTHGSRPEEIAIGEANVNLAEARLREAQKQFDRAQALREGVTVTRVQIDQAERDAHMAEAMLAEVRTKLTLLKVGSREEDIAEARARRDAAKARLEEVAARLAYCTVDAPISGVILSIGISSGQLVSSMAPTTLITMVDDRKRRVRAFVGERDVSKICLGEQAQIATDGIPGTHFDGIVDSIAPGVSESPYDPGQPLFREVLLSIPRNTVPAAIGLRVSLQFPGCGS